MSFLAFLDMVALKLTRLFWRPNVGDYASEVAGSIERLADMVELAGDALFAIAGGIHTEDTAAQRNMAAVFKQDALNKHRDVLRKLTDQQRKDLDDYILAMCKGSAKKR
jgi:hypothetical protein